jgi:epoxide hydrolase-like predicted phosphatase
VADVLLIDFGGVLTSNPFVGFESFCVAEGLAPTRFLDVLRDDPEAGRLLVAFEEGRVSETDFDRGMAPLLGPGVAHRGLTQRLTGQLVRDEAMLDAVAALRAAGVTTVLVSNSLGYHAYEGYDLDALFDHVVISGKVRKRKPSRRIYRYALELAGKTPERSVFVDDFQHNIDAAERIGIESILHSRAVETIPRLEAAFGVEITA